MAKVERGIINFLGKLGDYNIVKGSRKQAHLRKPVKPGTKKNEPALKKQYKRTAYLNELASQINVVAKSYSGVLKTSSFYRALLRHFLGATVDNRYLLLLKLKGLEINSDYRFSRLSIPEISCWSNPSHINVKLEVSAHPHEGDYKADCYYYEAVLMQWSKRKEAPTISNQLSEWISMSGRRPEFEFRFRKIAAPQQWLLMMRICLGQDNKAFGFMATEGMQVVEAGTALKSDLVLASKTERNDKIKEKGVKKNIEEPERVKAKRFV